MEILKGIEIIGPALFIKKEKVLIVSDLHIGQEEIMHREGMHIPINQYEQINKFMEQTLEELNPKMIIINGDLKHDFGKITKDERDKITLFLKNLKKYANIIVIEGNHDKLLQHITNQLKLEIKQNHVINSIYICHGDKIPRKDEKYDSAKTIIIGHEHPAIKLTNRLRTETYKCFLKGRFETKNLIVMPSLNPIREGSDILSQKLLSPFLKKTEKSDLKKIKNTTLKNEKLSKSKKSNLKDFECYILDDNNKQYFFGKLKNIENFD